MNIKYLNFHDLLIKLNQKEKENIKNQYLNLLSNLSDTRIITDNIFFFQLDKIFQNGLIIIAYIEENNKIKLIGSGTLFLQPKLSHGGKNIGQIEDIVVDNNYRNLGIGKNIILKLLEETKTKNCYKIILSCSENLKNYYYKLGFNESGILMKKI